MSNNTHYLTFKGRGTKKDSGERFEPINLPLFLRDIEGFIAYPSRA
jgi:hypothetical protein